MCSLIRLLVRKIRNDLIKKALRKLPGRALRTAKQSLRPLKKIKITEVNEIDVTEGWLYS